MAIYNSKRILLLGLKGDSVEANPTLSGTEADLTGLKVGNTKYKVPSGGSGGTTVVANPGATSSNTPLTSVTIGSTTYRIGFIDVDEGNPPVSGDTYRIGDGYINSNNNKFYICTAITGTTYTWTEIGGGGSEVITGATAPTISTVGQIGQFYLKTGSPRTLYVCVQYIASEYIWREIETTSNKVTSVSSASTDTQYPSAKCMYDFVMANRAIPENISTAAGMDAVLIAANVGKAYKYTGTTTADYTNGDIYVVEEA